MARRAVVQETKRQEPKRKKWGVVNVSSVVIQGAAGSYTQWRCPYYARMPYGHGGQPTKTGDFAEIHGFNTVRRAAASSVSEEDARAKAQESQMATEDFESAYWRFERGETLPPEVRVEEEDPTPIRMNIIDCANQTMAGRKRYVGRKVAGHRHSYKEKQQNYLNHLTASGLAEKMMDRLTLAEINTWFIGFMEGHAESTAARFKSWLIQVGNWAMANEYWRKNLFALLPELVPTVSEDSKRIFTFDEIDRMWDACTTPQQKAELVLLRLGFRQGEVLQPTRATSRAIM